jgi:hypothetical protein
MEDLLVFRPRNPFQVMRNMGAESAFYEYHDVGVSEEVRQEEDDYYAGVTARWERSTRPENGTRACWDCEGTGRCVQRIERERRWRSRCFDPASFAEWVPATNAVSGQKVV